MPLEADHPHTSGGYAFLVILFKRIHWWFPVNAARPIILGNKTQHLSVMGMTTKAVKIRIMLNLEKVKSESTNPSPAILTELFTIILLIKEQTLSSS